MKDNLPFAEVGVGVIDLGWGERLYDDTNRFV
jgi:hypothetical protein